MWIPLAVKYEIPLEIFRKLNPKIMERYLPFFKEQARQRLENISSVGWVNGIYVGRAINGCFAKNAKYPEEPMKLWTDGESAEEVSDPFTDADRFAIFAATFNKNNFE